MAELAAATAEEPVAVAVRIRSRCPRRAAAMAASAGTNAIALRPRMLSSRPGVAEPCPEPRASATVPANATPVDASPVDSAGATPVVPPRQRPQRRALVLAATVIAAAVSVGAVWSAIERGDGLSRVHAAWIAPAIVLAAISMLTASLQQRRVLAAGGLRVPVTSMVAIAVAGNAISVTLPLAGSTAGTAFTYQQLKRRGADLALAGWSLAMSGIVSTSVLAFVLGLGATWTGDGTASVLGPITIVLGITPMLALVASFRWPTVRAVLEQATRRAIVALQHHVKRASRLDPGAVTATFDRVAGFRIGWRGGLSAAGWSILNWTTDIACLALCVAALGTPVPWAQLAVVYAAALGAASLSFTPAGIGIVEGAVALALVQSGLPAEVAIIAALMYRAISCWLVLAIGWVTYAVLRGASSLN